MPTAAGPGGKAGARAGGRPGGLLGTSRLFTTARNSRERRTGSGGKRGKEPTGFPSARAGSAKALRQHEGEREDQEYEQGEHAPGPARRAAELAKLLAPRRGVAAELVRGVPRKCPHKREGYPFDTTRPVDENGIGSQEPKRYLRAGSMLFSKKTADSPAGTLVRPRSATELPNKLELSSIRDSSPRTNRRHR